MTDAVEDIRLFFSQGRAIAWSASTYENYRRALLKLVNEIPDLANLQPVEFEIWLESYRSNSARCVAYQACRQFLIWRYGPLHPALDLSLIHISEPTRPY